MARPVVAATTCVHAITSAPQAGLLSAESEAGYAEQLQALLADPQAGDQAGAEARAFVLRHYSWDAHLAGLDRHLEAA